MTGYLPGTRIEVNVSNENEVNCVIDGIFSCGGLTLSQVSSLTGVELYTVQNWVKRGFCTSPVSKKYSKRQFFRIVMINMLKDCFTIQQVTELLSYLNGHLDDESDDMIGDDMLYMYFLKSLYNDVGRDTESMEKAIALATSEYKEPFAGGCTRLKKALGIVLYAYYSTEFKNAANIMMRDME